MRLYVYVLFVYVRLVAGSKTETTLTRGNKDAGRPVCLTEPEGTPHKVGQRGSTVYVLTF